MRSKGLGKGGVGGSLPEQGVGNGRRGKGAGRYGAATEGRVAGEGEMRGRYGAEGVARGVALAVDMALAGGAARCGRQRKCGKNAVKSLTGGGRGRIFRALTRWPAARAAAAVHTERGQRGTGGGAAVGEMFTGAGAGAMTYLIFRRLHYGSI